MEKPDCTWTQSCHKYTLIIFPRHSFPWHCIYLTISSGGEAPAPENSTSTISYWDPVTLESSLSTGSSSCPLVYSDTAGLTCCQCTGSPPSEVGGCRVRSLELGSAVICILQRSQTLLPLLSSLGGCHLLPRSLRSHWATPEDMCLPPDLDGPH